LRERVRSISAHPGRRQIALTPFPLRPFMAAALAAGLLVLGGVFADSATRPDATQAAARAVEAKLRTLRTVEAGSPHSQSPIVITENEANSYLKIHGREFLPPGVRDPAIRFLPERVVGVADVNFEEFSHVYSNPNDWGPKVMAAMFKGTQHVTATGRVQSGNRQAKAQIESVTVGTMKVPSWLVDFIVENYLQPRYKFDLSKPIPLPDHVTEIALGTGRAIFLRSLDKPR